MVNNGEAEDRSALVTLKVSLELSVPGGSPSDAWQVESWHENVYC